MINHKLLCYILIGANILLVSCGSDVVQEEVDTETTAIEDTANEETNSLVLYRQNAGVVEKCIVNNGSLNVETATEDEIEEYQLDELLENRILVWQDCFEGDALKQDFWHYETGHVRNNEPQTYVAGDNNLSVKDGILKITAKCEEKENGYDWTSASIETRGHKQFNSGRIEAKIRFSNVSGQWGAFWTMGAWLGVDWPKCGEIDICEQYGDSNADYYVISSTMHYANPDEEHIKTYYEAHSYNNQLNNQLYHIFAVEWENEELHIYIDDNLIAQYNYKTNRFWRQFEQYNTGCNPFLLPQFLKLNLAVNPDVEPDILNLMTMEVDWVRVYASKEVEDFSQVIPTKLGIDYVYKVTNADKIPLSDLNWHGSVGEEIYLGAIYLPQTVVDRTCEFSVDDEEIATIDQSGKLVVNKEGTVVVTVRDVTSGITASRKINISFDE